MNACSKLLHAATCLALLLSPALRVESQAPNTSAPAPPGILTDVGGYRVHLYCIGQGNPTVMIVGAAFSFDWGLVQPEVAKFTRVCTFDPSGTAWSDPFRATTSAISSKSTPVKDSSPTCDDRVDEIHRLIMMTPINGPYVLVGFSWELFGSGFIPTIPRQHRRDGFRGPCVRTDWQHRPHAFFKPG